MSDNATRTLLAQLLMRPSEDQMTPWLQPYLVPRARPSRDFGPPEEAFRSPRPPGWVLPEQMHNGKVVPPETWDPWPPPPPVLYPSYDPFRRRLEEFDMEYPRRPLRRR